MQTDLGNPNEGEECRRNPEASAGAPRDTRLSASAAGTAAVGIVATGDNTAPPPPRSPIIGDAGSSVMGDDSLALVTLRCCSIGLLDPPEDPIGRENRRPGDVPYCQRVPGGVRGGGGVGRRCRLPPPGNEAPTCRVEKVLLPAVR